MSARETFLLRLLRVVPGMLLILVLVVAALGRSPDFPAGPGVGPVGIVVADIDRSVDFYSNILSFEKISDEEFWGAQPERLQGLFGLRMRVVRMRLGDEFIELTEYLTPRGRPMPNDSRGNDGWFQHIAIIVSDMARAYDLLHKNRVRHASPAPQRLPDWNPQAGGIEAFYFQDPDGHFLEILRFPEGKGATKWQRSTPLFLGIDHTAIVVADTERSLHFYQGLLGLQVAGRSENHGMEQERLNNVFGARLRITTLHGSFGPGIEFLEYLTPPGGRDYPAESRSNDLWAWQTRLVTSGLLDLEKKLMSSRVAWVSPGVVELPDKMTGFRRAVTLRDPDGHFLQIGEE